MQRSRLALRLTTTAVLAALSTSYARAQITVTPDTVAANLADALFDSGGIGCITPTVNLLSHTSGTAMSSGTFTVGVGTPYGLSTLGGVVLSTGDVADFSSGPNLVMPNSLVYGVAATPWQDFLLDSIQGVTPSTWNDVTQLDIAFVSPASWSGRLVFEVVFATDEYLAQTRDDAFALLHNGVNLAEWLGDGVHMKHDATALFTETEHDAAIHRLPGSSPASAVMTFVTAPIAPSTFQSFTFIIGDQVTASHDSTAYISMHVEDCNGNLIADYCDVVTAASADLNDNGIPDECESVGVDVETFCVCDGNPISGPCLNNVPVGIVAGCINSTGLGGKLAVSGGVTACPTPVSFDITDVRPNGIGILILSPAPNANAPSLGDGRLCLKGPIQRFGIGITNIFGQRSIAPPITASNGMINCGETRYFQYWFRDPSGPCNLLSNLTNAVKVTF